MVKEAVIYIYKTVVCVCSHFIGRVFRCCTPRLTEVWRARWPVVVDTRSLACGSSMKRGRSMKKKKPGRSSSQRPYPKIRLPAGMSRIQDLRVSAHAGSSKTTASRRSTFSSQEERQFLLSPLLSRLFKSRTWAVKPLSVAWLPFSWRTRGSVRSETWSCGKVGEPFLLDCRLCSIIGVRVTVTCECAFHVTSSTCRWNSICCGKEAFMMLRRWSFSFFFVSFLTRRSPHRRNRRLRCRQGPYRRRCSFSPLFLSGSQPPPTSVFQKIFTTVKRVHVKRVHVWVEWSRSDRVGWSRGGSETAMLCGSLTLQLWQSHIVAVFPCSFFRAVEHHGVQPESLSYHSKLTWLLFPCCYYASSTMSNFSP